MSRAVVTFLAALLVVLGGCVGGPDCRLILSGAGPNPSVPAACLTPSP